VSQTHDLGQLIRSVEEIRHVKLKHWDQVVLFRISKRRRGGQQALR
jgi:hypothetical protein